MSLYFMFEWFVLMIMVELGLCNECNEFVGYAHNFIYTKGLRYKDQWNKQLGSFSLVSSFRSSGAVCLLWPMSPNSMQPKILRKFWVKVDFKIFLFPQE